MDLKVASPGVCHAPDQQKQKNGRLEQGSACFVG